MPDWRHFAACRGTDDPNLFFPIGDTPPALKQIEDAKAVCLGCPVMDECRTWALNAGQLEGVWGGMSERERIAFKRSANGRGVRYGEEVREDAVARYKAIRPTVLSDWAACTLVAWEFGIAKVHTVMKWTESLSTERRPGQRADFERREQAIALVARVRPYCRSEKAAYEAAAARLGVHWSTVGSWVREARAARQAAVAAKGVKSR